MDQKPSILRHQLRALQRDATGSINGLSLVLRLSRVFAFARTRVYRNFRAASARMKSPALNRRHRHAILYTERQAGYTVTLTDPADVARIDRSSRDRATGNLPGL